MSRRPSTTGGQHSFATLPRADIERSAFNRNCGLKTTFDAGLLVPIFVDEALPGDTINLRATIFARFATPLKPILDNVHLDTFFFAVPNRLLWENWQRFNGEQDNPGDSVDYLVPSVFAPSVDGWGLHSMGDYFGIPTGVASLQANALHFRAYNLIYNEWFRSQDLIDSVAKNVDDGPDNPGDYQILRRTKRHDFFTSCLPFPQKGDAVTIPIGDTAPVTMHSQYTFSSPYGADLEPTFSAGGQGDFRLEATDAPGQNLQLVHAGAIPVPGGGPHRVKWDQPQLRSATDALTGSANLAAATATTINDLRTAFQLQRLYERDARGGTRYTEVLYSHFKVSSPDQRLQRPEYLGGGTTLLNVASVPQTSESDANTPQGNLAGYGVASSSQRGFVKSFTEHCVIIGLICARADLSYQQGLNRMWSRQTRWDFYWPALSHLGEQSVYTKEIYATEDDEANDTVFGYQERYSEYRYKPSMTTGLMRSQAENSLDIWHLAQDFSNAPVLGQTFIEENPPIDRVIAVPSEPHFLLDAFFNFKHVRPMPTFAVPGMIDHF